MDFLRQSLSCSTLLQFVRVSIRQQEPEKFMTFRSGPAETLARMSWTMASLYGGQANLWFRVKIA